MTYDPEIHHRRSIRLRGWDYARPGAYFVTICTQGKCHVFGEIVEGEMVLNEAGELVRRAWEDLPRRFAMVALDEFTVMPNHVHGIMFIVGAGLALPRARQASPLQAEQGTASRAPTLADVVRVFKSTSAIAVNALLDCTGKPLWQRNYYERIIQNKRELDVVREYVVTNPLRWASDPENRAATNAQPDPWA